MSYVLLIRGVIGLAFALSLATATGIGWEAYLAVLAWYLVADGLIATVIAATFMRESIMRQRTREMVLGVVLWADAGGRTLSGIALHLWPGIGGFPVTTAAFIGIMATCTAAVGVAEVLVTAREEIARHGSRHQPAQFMAGPVGIASVISIAFGVAAIAWIGEPDTVRQLISGFVGAAGILAIAMSWSRWRMTHSRRRAVPG